MKTFRAPQSVRDVARNNSDDLSKRVAAGDALDTSDLVHIVGDSSCGEVGRRWSRRLLKQERVLQDASTGNTEIPRVVDLYLGPSMFAGYSNLNVEDSADALAKAGSPGICVPYGDGCFVVVPSTDDWFIEENTVTYGDSTYNKGSQKELSLSLEKCAEAIVVDDSRARMPAVVKQAEGAVSVKCHEVSELQIGFGKMTLDRVFTIESQDKARRQVQMMKVDESLGLVFGWAIICKIDGEEYFDLQDDHIPEDSMLEASTEFMIEKRDGGEMHWREEDGSPVVVGKIVFAFPLTEEIAKSFGVESNVTGLMIAFKPDSDDVLQKFKDGEYTGFSIGGSRDPNFDEEVE